jgi:hypothetical protein
MAHWIPRGPVEVRIKDDVVAPRPYFLGPQPLPPPHVWATEVRSVELGPGGARLEVELGRGAAIAGTAIDSAGGPVQGSRFTVTEPPATETVFDGETDDAGRFEASGLKPGHRYALAFATPPVRDDIQSKTVELEAPAKDVPLRFVCAGPLRVELRFRTARVAGAPDSEEYKHSLEHYVVRYEWLDERTGQWLARPLPEPSRYHDASPLIRPDPAPGSWRVVVLSGMRDEVASEPIVVADGMRALTLPVSLEPGRAISGRVVDASGEPVPNAVVHCDQNGRVRGESEFIDRKTREGTYQSTGADGRFVLPDVPLDAARLLVWVPGSRDLAEATVEVPVGTTSAGDIALRRR